MRRGDCDLEPCVPVAQRRWRVRASLLLSPDAPVSVALVGAGGGAAAAQAMEELVLTTARGMAAEGTPFVGTLFAGLMIKDGKVSKVARGNSGPGPLRWPPVMQRRRSSPWRP